MLNLNKTKYTDYVFFYGLASNNKVWPRVIFFSKYIIFISKQISKLFIVGYCKLYLQLAYLLV